MRQTIAALRETRRKRSLRTAATSWSTPSGTGATTANGGLVARIVTRGFRGRRQAESEKLPPGQYLTPDFPALSAGPAPRTPLDSVDLPDHRRHRSNAGVELAEFRGVPAEMVTTTSTASPAGRSSARSGRACRSTYCSMRSTRKRRHVRHRLLRRRSPPTSPLADLVGGRAWIASDTTAPRSSPARRPCAAARPAPLPLEERQVGAGLRYQDRDEPGFWESLGYHRLVTHGRKSGTGATDVDRGGGGADAMPETPRVRTLRIRAPGGDDTSPVSTWTSG